MADILHEIICYRGGASGATFTNHVAGNRAISDIVVYPSYNTRACANGAELAKLFFTGKGTLT